MTRPSATWDERLKGAEQTAKKDFLNQRMSTFNEKLLPAAAAGGFDCIVWSTDKEPDDAVAAYMAKNVLKRVKVLWIVGEGRKPKLQLARDQLAALGVDCVIVQGKFSEREFPDEMMTAFAAGQQQPQAEQADAPDCVATLRLFLEQHERPLFVMLKPCW